jgi:hypothetical protein
VERELAHTLDQDQTRKLDQERYWFKTFLQAIYQMPIQLSHASSLRPLVIVADFYRGLQSVSRAVTSVMFQSHLFVSTIQDDPYVLLLLAKKLRIKVLFKESYIHAVGRWHETIQTLNQSPELIALVRKGNSRIMKMIVNAQGLLVGELIEAANLGHDTCLCRKMGTPPPYDPKTDSIFGTPAASAVSRYYRHITRKCSHGRSKNNYCLCLQAKEALKPLLRNNLTLRTQLEAGSDPTYYFLCADLNEEDYPWNADETDW